MNHERKLRTISLPKYQDDFLRSLKKIMDASKFYSECLDEYVKEYLELKREPALEDYEKVKRELLR